MTEAYLTITSEYTSRRGVSFVEACEQNPIPPLHPVPFSPTTLIYLQAECLPHTIHTPSTPSLTIHLSSHLRTSAYEWSALVCVYTHPDFTPFQPLSALLDCCEIIHCGFGNGPGYWEWLISSSFSVIRTPSHELNHVFFWPLDFITADPILLIFYPWIESYRKGDWEGDVVI